MTIIVNSKRSLEQGTLKTAVIYARYSSHSQREVSIEQQVEACRAYAKRNGIQIIEVYADKAISGKTDSRPNFQRMMRDAEKHKFETVIAWKSNRMGRNMLQAMINEERLDECGIKCLYVEEDFDDTAAGRFALRNMMNVNQFYSENMAEDITRGLMDNATKCMVNGRVAYGYRKGADGRFEIDPPSAAIVKEIFDRVLSGWRFVDIADDLNRRGIKTSYGNEWNKGSFHRMLANEQYTGVYKYSGIRIENGVPTIISKEQFEEVQRFLRTKDRPVGQRRDVAEYLLTGKIFCGRCNSPMVGISGTGKSGYKGYYYKCRRKKQDHSCDKENVRRDLIESLVIKAIRDSLMSDELIDFVVDGYTALQETCRKDSALKALEVDLSDTEKSIGNLMKAIEAGIITESTKERLLELEDRKKQLKYSISLEEKVLDQSSPDEIRFWLEHFRSGDIEDKAYQKELIRIFLQSVYVYDDHLKIIFNYGGDEQKVPFSEIESSDYPQSNLSQGFDCGCISSTI